MTVESATALQSVVMLGSVSLIFLEPAVKMTVESATALQSVVMLGSVSLIFLEPAVRFELTTYSLQVSCSTN